jgi:broad specificity phosphatase PhoE
MKFVPADNLLCRYVSPRHRAQRTLELLNLGCQERYPWHKDNDTNEWAPPNDSEAKQDGSDAKRTTKAEIQITPSISEWDYGDYEGLTSPQIRQSRKERGLSENWDIWRDGCEGGESPEDVTARLDELIKDIREKWHKGRFGKGSGWKGKAGGGVPNDVLIVAHGHILRSFAARWVGKKLEDNPSLILEAGGVGTLR